MSAEPSLTRRSVLRASTAATGAACALALAGCSGGAPADSKEAGGAASPSPSAVPSGGAPVRVGKVTDVPVGQSATGTANGVNVLVFRPDAKTVLAYNAKCTHAGCAVGAQGAQFVCPCHGSTFNASDGTVVVGPAKQPLERYAAAIDGDWITVSV
ncbi:ubiquinol-cytochrome c reductase iron-sulfur subunit [Specibacter cremeus]|uniref:QcrA and Rieske domain-containing protein n=1 Tax=Specibacter cremeus TaxID=1629051 RepID=UPI000F778EE8|nr:Rieske (2Fe-2S) protein [Specibacter cremeus]